MLDMNVPFVQGRGVWNSTAQVDRGDRQTVGYDRGRGQGILG